METPFPTRAEVSDIFNAIMQKADAVMTSGETALGKYPIEAIQMMNKIIIQAESNIHYHYKEFFDESYSTDIDLQRKALVRSALEMSNTLQIKTIILFTISGRLAKIAAAYRPKPNVFAFTKNWNTFTKAALYFGIKSRYCEYDYHVDGVQKALNKLIDMGDITPDENIIVISDIRKGENEYPSLDIIQVQSYLN